MKLQPKITSSYKITFPICTLPAMLVKLSVNFVMG